MRKAKVLHYGLSSNIGGIETYLLRMARLIDKGKYELHFLVSEDEKCCFYSELKALGCYFHQITPRKRSFLGNRKDLDCLFREGDFDIFHAHLNSLSYVAPVLYAEKYGVANILHSRSSSASSFRVRLFHFLNRVLLMRKEMTKIAVSKQAGDWLFSSGSKFVVMHNGVDGNQYVFDEAARAEIRKQIGVSESCIVLGHVGAFLPVKNHDFLLDISESLHLRDVNFRLLLIGSGPRLCEVKEVAKAKGIADKVVFMGLRDDLQKLYSAMDVFLFPSKFEGFGNVVLEAQANGLPCVISDTVIEDLALSNKCQFLRLSDGPHVWADKILQMNKVSSGKRVESLYDLESSRYSSVSEIARLEAVYESILSRKQ